MRMNATGARNTALLIVLSDAIFLAVGLSGELNNYSVRQIVSKIPFKF